MTKYDLVLVFATIFWLASATRADDDHCYRSACDHYTLRESIAALWKVPQALTPLACKLRAAILHEVQNCRDDRLPLLLSQSLWLVDFYTGMRHDSPPTGVYGKLIKATVCKSSPIRSHSKYGARMDEAIDEYGELCNSAIEQTINLGLKNAGCPYKKRTLPLQPPVPQDSSYVAFLRSGSNGLYPSTRQVIEEMSRSKRPLDRLVASGALAAATPNSVRLFRQLLQCSDNFLRGVQLKACVVPIPRECCGVRKQVLETTMRKLIADVDIQTAKIIQLSKIESGK